MIGRPATGALALAVAAAGIALLAGQPPASRTAALAPVSIDLPTDDAGPPHPDLLTQRCTACHSAAMIDTQPVQTREGWAAVVKKMREIYKAPVADAEVPAILDQLAAISAAHQTGI